MNLRVSGAFATATIFALTSAASAQSTTNFYKQIQGGYQQGAIAPAATSTFQATPSTSFNGGGSVYAPTANFGASQGSTYLPQPQTSYTQPTISTFGSQQVGNSYIPAPTATTTVQQPALNFSATTPSYASPYTPTTQPGFAPSIPPTYVAPSYGTATTIYQGRQLPSYQAQQLPVFQQPGFGAPAIQQPVPLPATAVVPNKPTTPKPAANSLPDSDRWSFNLARFYPAIQACLRKSSAKNPVIANVQVRPKNENADRRGRVVQLLDLLDGSQRNRRQGEQHNSLTASRVFRTVGINLHGVAGSSVPTGCRYRPESHRLARSYEPKHLGRSIRTSTEL